jgi:hypothetical protein
MRKVLILLVLVFIAIGTAYAWVDYNWKLKIAPVCQTDWKCQMDCYKAGYNYDLCKQTCTYCH